MNVVTIVLLLIVGILFVLGLNIYNGLISLKNQLVRAWANIDVVLKQRYDEIPQLLQVIEQYAGYESEIIKNLVEARSRYGSARSQQEKLQSGQEMSLALTGVLALGENYPDLKANESFLNLQNRISALESSLVDRRETYNDLVASFNTRLEQFPDVLAARILGYQEQAMFEVTEAERQAPNLKMNLPKWDEKK